MASLSNINGIFDVHSTGAIQFNGNHGTAGQILKSNGNAAPTWVAASTVIGGPYLPLTGGTLTGATATASGISFTVGGTLSASNFSGSSSGTNTGDQTSVTGASGYLDTNRGTPSSAAQYWQAYGLGTTEAPSTDWYNTWRGSHGNPLTYYSNTLAIKMTGTGPGTIYVQTISNGTALGWNKYWHDGNLPAGSGVTSVAVTAGTGISASVTNSTTTPNITITNTAPNIVQTSVTGNAGTSTTFSTGRTNYKGVTDGAVAGQMMWKNYGNLHTIFDASAGVSPQGNVISNTNSINAWTATYPTLMGWNGSSTYGVRVDSARIADSAANQGNYLLLAGGTVTGSTDFTAGTYPLDVYGIGSTAGSSAVGLGIYGSSTAGAIMHFHRPGAYAVNFGLDSDNVLRIGGWSAGANRWTLDMSGNNTIAGKITASSATIAGYSIFGMGLSTGSWYGDLGSYGYTRETGLAMTGGSEFVVLSKNGQGSTLVDGAYLAYESANGFFGSYNSSYGNLTGIQATAANTLTVKQLDGGSANLTVSGTINGNLTGNVTGSSGSCTGNSATATLATTATNANNVVITGYGNSTFTFYQSSGTFAGFSGWHNYYIGNHGNGSNYYNTTIAFPFWGPPRYSRREGNVLRGPYNFLTDEQNYTTNYYIQSNASLRAPIFYDTNTAYYGDFAGTSNINALTLAGTLSGQNAYFNQDVGIGFNSGNIGGKLNIKINSNSGIGIKNNLNGVNSPTGLLSYTSASMASGGYHLVFQAAPMSGTDTNMLLCNINGNLRNRNNSYGQYSDETIKENIVDATPKLEDVKKLKVKNFNFIGDNLKQIGLIAQETEKVFPGLVEDDLNPQGDRIKSLKYSVLVPILVKAIQELEARVKELENK